MLKRDQDAGCSPGGVWKRISSLALCAALFVACGLPGRAFALDFTSAERLYLKSDPVITVCVDPDWEPFERIDDRGEYVGIAADLLRLAFKRAGLRMRVLHTASWDESLAASRTGQCDVLSFLNETPARSEWLIFTAPIFTDPNVFITREEHPLIENPADLTNETIVFPKGTSMEERVRRDYPNLVPLRCDTENQAMNMVSDRRADMTLRSLIVAAYTIKKEGLFNLKIAGKLPDYANVFRVGALKDRAMLRDIISKGILSITPEERERIVNNHVAINVETVVDKALIAKIAAVFLLIIAVSAYWNVKLKRLSAELARRSETDALTGLANRMKIDAVLRSEFDRSRRYGRPLSVIMFDIDHFKKVNDEFGHLTGDKVLVEVAQTARRSVRGTDMAGRWGGEEFLAACPETGLEEALAVAARICEAMRGRTFATGRVQTVSAGVAELLPEDTVDSMLSRADAALYKAKNEGRDRAAAL